MGLLTTIRDRLRKRYDYAARAALPADEAFRRLSKKLDPRLESRVPDTLLTPDSCDAIEAELRRLGVVVETLFFSRDEWARYVTDAGYAARYPNYYTSNLPEKSFEHALGLRVLAPRTGEMFIDVAAENSPVGEIYARLTGCESYEQDIMYPPGLNGRKIGCDAAHFPLPDASVSAALASCSIEHFEGRSDTLFFKEMARILKPGGRVFVAPLYIHTDAFCQTDPINALGAGLAFEEFDRVCAVPGWGNRHGRFYSPATLAHRVLRATPELDFTVYRLLNTEAIDASVYARFALVARKV